MPVDPQRAVTLDQFELPVVGAVTNGSMRDPDGVIAPLLDGVEQVGPSIGEPNLEAMAALEPDLILGGFPSEDPLDQQLKAIAPAYLGIDFETSAQWKKIFSSIGEAVGRGEDAEALLQQYEQRAQAVTEDADAEQVSVASVRAYPDQVSVYGPDSFLGVVLTDAGVELFVPSGEDGFAQDLSYEQISTLTSDVLVVWTANEDDPQAVEEQLRTSPLWGSLLAVQAGRVSLGGEPLDRQRSLRRRRRPGRPRGGAGGDRGLLTGPAGGTAQLADRA